MECVADVIGLWPSLQDFSADIDAPVALVRVWKHRRFIPADRWAAIEAAAERRNLRGATASDLARLAARRSNDGAAA